MKTMKQTKKKRRSDPELEELRFRLEEAEETLRAIRSGEVDAVVVSGSAGEQLYTLQGADRSYRILLETMGEGAATLAADGTILYCNRRMADMLGAPHEQVTGSSIRDYLSPADWPYFNKLLGEGDGIHRREFDLRTAEGALRPALISLGRLSDIGIQGFVLTAADLTEHKKMEEELRQSHHELERRTAKLQESEGRLRALASELINAQETERKRIANELHDSLAAQLAAIKYRVEHRGNPGNPAQTPVALQETVEDIQNAITETRRIMANLRPSILDDLGIIPALSWFSRDIKKTYPGTVVKFSGSVEEEEVSEELKIVLFRVVQESVTNALRHGKSTRIRIGLEKNNGWLRLTIRDNGTGFESVERKSSTGGMGLPSMQQRVESTAGIFSVSSLPGKGTLVKAEWKIL